MATYTFDFRKTAPATGGQRRDYIKPGRYTFKVDTYSDKPSATGKEMHAFTSIVQGKSPEAGKALTDYFVMPKTSKDPQFPKERLLAFFLSLGSKTAQGKSIQLDPARLKGKTFEAEVVDRHEEATVRDGTTYPARTTSVINRYIFDGDEEDADDEEDEEEEEEEDDESDDDEDEEDDESDDDDNEEDDDEEDEDDEEEEPAPKPRRGTRTPAKPAKPAAKASAKTPVKAASKPAKKSSKASDDFPFD